MVQVELSRSHTWKWTKSRIRQNLDLKSSAPVIVKLCEFMCHNVTYLLSLMLVETSYAQWVTLYKI